jgi:hypothetical protein
VVVGVGVVAMPVQDVVPHLQRSIDIRHAQARQKMADRQA